MAEYTIEQLRFNSRDYLVQARNNAYNAYKDSLTAYIQMKKDGASTEELLKKKEAIESRHHPTVWFEMKRQFHFYPVLAALFDKADELLE